MTSPDAVEPAIKSAARRDPRRRQPTRAQRDRGSSLIITIGFVLMIGSIAGGLAGLITSSMNNRATLAQQRDRQYAADAAVEEAVALVRTSKQSTAESCTADVGTLGTGLNGVKIRVDWTSACTVVRGDDGAIVAQRNVVFVACRQQDEACSDDTSIVRAQVNFEQGVDGQIRRTTVQSWSVNG
jgi:hypothetical protein